MTRSLSSYVVIIGGGASGTMTAWHLLRRRPDLGAGGVVIVEPRSSLGAGQAYGSTDLQHRINVPAQLMSIDTENPGDFSNWLEDNFTTDVADDPSYQLFPPRSEFANYLSDRIAQEIESGSLVHVRAEAIDISQDNSGWEIATSDGTILRAVYIVIATSHPPPSLPGPLPALKHDRRIIANPWSRNALSAIKPNDSVAIIGTGLSMADVVASLSTHKHQGPIIAFSRRGLLARGHTKTANISPIGDFSSNPSNTLSGLVANIHAALATLDRDQTWHAVFDALRKQGGNIWDALPTVERQRLIRHLRPFWDVHRFRMAPPVESIVHARISNGSLKVIAARLIDVRAEEHGVSLLLRPRYKARPEDELRITVQHVVNTTGPDHSNIFKTFSYLGSLAQQGFVERDIFGLGLHTDPTHRAVTSGKSNSKLFIVGPLARATFGELMGLPEVTINAQSVARTLAGEIDKERHCRE